MREGVLASRVELWRIAPLSAAAAECLLLELRRIARLSAAAAERLLLGGKGGVWGAGGVNCGSSTSVSLRETEV